MTRIYEACVTSVSAARAAERAGAHRLELCARLRTGGMTPPAARVAAVKAAVSLPVHIMIRCTSRGFRCGTEHRKAMQAEIAGALHAGADGLVLGVLDEHGRVDQLTMAALMSSAESLPVTFHRAFDETPDQLAALEQLVELGVHQVLTSGGAPTARQGAARLRDLVTAARDRIGIIAAGRVRADHAASLIAATGVHQVHAHLSSGREMRALAAALRPPSVPLPTPRPNRGL